MARPRPELRDTLFGDLPWSEWPAAGEATELEPWRAFAEARSLAGRGDEDASARLLKRIVSTPGLESRHYLQAWRFLREVGVGPSPEVAKELLGVIVEVGMPGGTDIVVAYSDHCARYHNFSGSGVVWEAPDDSLHADIDALLAAGREVLAAIGPWPHARPPAPRDGHARISLLAPSGLHFGEGPFEGFVEDPMGGPVLEAATALLQALTAKATPPGG